MLSLLLIKRKDKIINDGSKQIQSVIRLIQMVPLTIGGRGKDFTKPNIESLR
jgi:hypothetical protein